MISFYTFHINSLVVATS